MAHFLLRKLFWGLLRHFLSDRQYIRFRYRLELGRWPDLENPKRFSEKIQWLKLNDRSPLRKKVADRLGMRDYVAETIGEEHLIPLIGTFPELTNEVWDELPEQFVIKASHGSGYIQIIRSKSGASFDEIKNEAESWLSEDYADLGREWVYSDENPFLIVEKLLLDSDGEPPADYKYFCFHGRAELIQIDLDRFSQHRQNFYDRDFRRVDIRQIYRSREQDPPKHERWEEGIELAEEVSEPFDFLRVDLYLLENRIYVGELTNFPHSGFAGFQPDEADLFYGEKLQLNL